MSSLSGQTAEDRLGRCALSVSSENTPDEGYVLDPGESTRIRIGVALQLNPGSGEDESLPFVPPNRVELAGARLGTVSPAGGQPISWREVPGGLESSITFTYTAGARTGADDPVPRVWNSEHGPDGESDLLACAQGEAGRVLVFIGGDWELYMRGTYEGHEAQGAGIWQGRFSVIGDSVRGSGVYHQVDRGTCFKSFFYKDFLILGTVDGPSGRPYVTLTFPTVGASRGPDPEIRDTPECYLKHLLQAGSLVLSVADKMMGGLEEVRLPLDSEADGTFNDVWVRITRSP